MKVKLESFLQEVSEKTTENNQYPVLTSSKAGLYLQSDYFNKQVASKDNTGYKIIKRGQFTYRAMSDTGEFFPNMLDCTDIGIVSPAYPVFEIAKPVVIPEFLRYYFKSNGFQHSISSFAQGSTRTSVKYGKLKTVTINVLEIEEQRKIIEILDTAQMLIEHRVAEIEKLDELIKARFVEMFGDPVVNEKGWATKPFLEMGTCKNGMNFHYDDAGVDINCLGVGDFGDLSIIEDTLALPLVSLNEMPSDEYLLKDDDIVFVRSNGNKALVGRSLAVYPGDVLTTFSGFCIRYRKNTDEILVPYLLRVLKSDSIRKKMAGRGANIQNLNQQILGTLVIPVPPIDLQNQFADFVAEVDKSKFRDINIIPEGGFYNGYKFFVS
jgi:type I restriction enzyme S subunit